MLKVSLDFTRFHAISVDFDTFWQTLADFSEFYEIWHFQKKIRHIESIIFTPFEFSGVPPCLNHEKIFQSRC